MNVSPRSVTNRCPSTSNVIVGGGYTIVAVRAAATADVTSCYYDVVTSAVAVFPSPTPSPLPESSQYVVPDVRPSSMAAEQ